jgi:hypothetical protein
MASQPELATPADFPSLEFFERVRVVTEEDPVFREGTEYFDGSVLLEIGDFTVWMKWYRGRIIDMHEGPDILGHTFALRAPLEIWRGVWELPRTSYRPWARLFNYGEIATEGNALEATRVMEATFVLISSMENEGRSR